MAHQRTVIRQTIRTLLDGATAAADRVFATRMLPLRKSQLPTISVYSLEETVDDESGNTAPRELTRELPVVIEGWVAPGANVDDAMDDLAEEIETAMHADPYLGNAAAESILTSTTLEVVIDGDREMGLVSLTYDVTYRTLAPEAPTLDDFITVGATYNPGNAAHPDDAAMDEFIVQETP